jgi:hypothetical protein
VNADMLPALHLLRDASRHGWRLARIAGPADFRFVEFERHDDDGRHWVRFDLGYLPKPGERFVQNYRSPSFVANTTDGELRGAHMSVRQMADVLRAFSGIRGSA